MADTICCICSNMAVDWRPSPAAGPGDGGRDGGEDSGCSTSGYAGWEKEMEGGEGGEKQELKKKVLYSTTYTHQDS